MGAAFAVREGGVILVTGGFAAAGGAGVSEVGRDPMRPAIARRFSSEEALGDQ